MDLTVVAADVIGAVRDAPDAIVPIGAGTHREVGNPIDAHRSITEVRAPRGIVSYDPADLTVTVLAGTSVAELQATLAEHRQEVVLDARDPAATVGGVLACGLSGPRRLRHGPVRDAVLEVQFVDGRGRLIKGGGPTVKNVTGYDLPRLLVGSLGTLGVIVQATLRCRPRPAASRWFSSDRDPALLARVLYRPSSLLWDGSTTRVLLEGYPDDQAVAVGEAALAPLDAAPDCLPGGPHRGRISIAPALVESLATQLARIPSLAWCAEIGVGTVHVASAEPDGLDRARAVAETSGGWLLREAGGGAAFDGFGFALPNRELSARVKAAFDPDERLAPGRLPR